MTSRGRSQAGDPPEARPVARAQGIVLALALLVLVASCGAAAPTSWLCLGVGADGTVDYSAPALDDSGWQAIELPDRIWSQRCPQQYSYGWYRYHFTPDPAFSGRDMVLKLGIVDDADATYCNGALIGQTGAFPPQASSAHNVDREYVIPASLLRYGADNVLAVKVYDMIGTGGLLGSPRLGYRLAEHDAWLVHNDGADGQVDRSGPELEDGGWEKAPMPDTEWDVRQPQDGVCGWYRLHFAAPEAWRDREIVLDLGFCLDADRAYVNGSPIGATGGFPPDARTAASQPRLYQVPAEALRYGADNVLAVQVHNSTARGGIWGRPAVLACGEAQDPTAAALQHARRLRSAGRYPEAWQAIGGLWEQTAGTAVRPALLNELTALYEASGQDDDALRAFSQLAREYPTSSPSREATLAVVRIQERRGALSDSVGYLGEDRHTQWRWWLRYGVDAFALCAAGGDCDVYGTPGTYAITDAFSRWKPEGGAPLQYWAARFDEERTRRMNWVSAVATKDPRALWNPVVRDGTFAWWDDKGEEHPFDEAGPDLNVAVTVPEGLWRLGVYQVDPDWGETWHPRLHHLVLTDAEGGVLAVADAGKFAGGAWQLFCVRGPRDLTLRVCKGPSICAVASALTLDRLDGAPGLPAGEGASAAPPPQWPDVAAAVKGYRESRASFATAEVAVTGADDVAQAWARWHEALSVAAAEESVQAAFERLVTATETAEGAEGVADRLAQYSSACFSHRRYRAAQMLDERWTRLWSEGRTKEGRPLDLAAGWLPIDDTFACALFEAELGHAAKLPAPEAAEAIAALALPFVKQGRAIAAEVASPSPHSIENHPQLGALARPVGIPGFAQRAVDRLRGMPQAAASLACRQLAMAWCRELLGGALETPGGPDAQITELDRVAQDSLGIADARADVLKTKVWVLAKEDRLAEAIRVADEFWALEPTIPLLKGFVGTVLGEALARAGRYDEAAASYRRALEACEGQEPRYAERARRALEEIEELNAAD